jgi:hypothetical protein
MRVGKSRGDCFTVSFQNHGTNKLKRRKKGAPLSKLLV